MNAEAYKQPVGAIVGTSLLCYRITRQARPGEGVALGKLVSVNHATHGWVPVEGGVAEELFKSGNWTVGHEN